MSRLTALVFVLALAAPSDLLAGKPKKDKGRSKGKTKEPVSATVTVTFSSSDRGAAKKWFVGKHGRGQCPPGLAKKRNGCLPPGQARKRYTVGQRLPSGVTLTEPPRDLIEVVAPAPVGYRYVMLDGDLVKLAVGTMLVVDAIQGLVD